MKSFIACLCLLTLSHSVGALSEFDVISPKAEISLITCGVGDQPHTLFGHSAVRVNDPLTGLDIVFNYGTFDFSKPGFLVDFINGRLDYYLSVSRFERFLALYVRENRDVKELVLDLDLAQRQLIFNALIKNYEPENRYYLYDFFFDNCSSRIRDIFRSTLGDSVRLSQSYAVEGNTFRDLIRPYIKPHPWIHFGIALILGSPTDKIAKPDEYMFLPDYLDSAFLNGEIYDQGAWKQLVKKERLLFDAAPPESDQLLSFITNPLTISWILFLIFCIITFTGRMKKQCQRWIDFSLFAFTGFLGFLFLYFWFGTDHTVLPKNYNVYWGLPTHLIAAFFIIKFSGSKWLRYYFIITAASLVIVILFWNSWPQVYHPAILPLCGILLMRSIYRSLAQ